MPEPSKAVLVTGCSSGIGKATAQRLAASGWNVYATARKPETLGDLEKAGCKTLALDVTDEASMQAAVSEVERAEGAVGVLVNNAGYSQSGAVESVPLDRLRAQFETNVFGLVRMCQLVLPKMRDQGWGKIVNVSSMGGRLVFPGGGAYHGTKYAVEALSDALRFEVRGFGVDVILIEPGLILTSFGDVAADTAHAVSEDDGPYSRFHAGLQKSMANVYQGRMGKIIGGGPDTVAKAIEKAISGRAPTRKLVTASARLSVGQRRLMTDRMWDRIMGTQFPRPGR
jgi:NAD(P)-dependent dehydrogenase (short-subunit alcohol dehydrogenase family)